MFLRLIAVLLLVISLTGFACQSWAQDDAEVAALYVKGGTWPETLLATRARYLEWIEARQGAGDIVIDPWFATGPLKAASFDEALPPEQEVLLNARDGENRRLWRRRNDWVDGMIHQLPAADYAATYLYRVITASQATTVTAGIGSDDGVALWLNGEKLLSNNVARGPARDQDRVALPLKAGENALLLKIYNRTGNHAFYFSIAGDPAHALWQQMEADYPLEAAWLQRDLSGGARFSLMNQQEGIQQIPDMIVRVAEACGEAAPAIHAEAAALKNASLRPQDPRWLDLYLKACQVRDAIALLDPVDFPALRRAILDLSQTYPDQYVNGAEYLRRLDAAEASMPKIVDAMARDTEAALEMAHEILALQREALMSNPLLDFDQLLLVRRAENLLGLPQNWQGNCSVPKTGYDNEIALLSPLARDAALTSIFRPEKGEFVGDVDLHFDADRMLFSMPGSHDRWQIWEAGVDGSNLRQVTPGIEPDVDNYDACYLPDERIIFDSTRCFQGIPCVGGGDTVANLYRMDPDGSNIRQLCFDQDHNWNPTVLNNGRVLFTRWEYSDTPHYFTRILFHMNPDGTNQMEYYGSNSYWPNSIFYARPIPNHPTQVVAIVSGHHGVPRMGELLLFDPALGRHEADGVVQRIPGYGQPVEPIIVDELVNNSWPRFLHPYPLSDKYFLVSCKPNPATPWGIYLVDIFDNMLLLHEKPGYALFEPIPLRPTPRPPIVPDRVNLDKTTATVYLADVYEGPGLKGVPHGTVKSLRLYSFHYTYPKMGGHEHVGVEGPWDVRRILGTVPVLEDGSASFKVPANTPIAVQPLDDEGKALQVMRSWFTAMPGEVLSCVGCHEHQNTAPPSRSTLASLRPPDEIAPWHGPERGFSFRHEVQPVLDRHCLGCHGGSKEDRPDFTAYEQRGPGNFNKSYLALHPFVRRPGPESDYHLQIPLEFHADTSELIQMLQKGHHGVELDAEAWDRLVTWIDLNVPDHGTWHDHRDIPNQFEIRRAEMRALYSCIPDDRSEVPLPDPPQVDYIAPTPVAKPSTEVPECPDWPFAEEAALARQAALGGETRRTIDLGDGVSMDFVLIPAGEYVMGSAEGDLDELPMTRVRIETPFWLGATEVNNRQYTRFDPKHNSRYINQHHKDHTTPGYPANRPEQPVIRITWHDALDFCNWLSQLTGETCTLPTEAQWEWACRAGSAEAMFFGDLDTDFSRFANLADASKRLLAVSGVDPKPIPNPTPFQDFLPKDPRFDDGQPIVCDVGQYDANPWGLKDMHGNVAEWTRTSYRPYPYIGNDGRNDGDTDGKKVVRGGSWSDRPHRARAAFRQAYHPWQGVYNVGFRVAIPMETMEKIARQ